MINRSLTNAFEVSDYTQELRLVPASWTLLGDAGLFETEALSTFTVSFEEQNGSLGLISDQVRGARPQAANDVVRKLHSFNIPHFPIVDKILPQDLQSKSAYGDLSSADNLAAQLERKMLKIRKSFDVTKEVARFQMLTAGTVYAPNGTVVTDVYTDFGITKKSVDFVLGTGTTDVAAKCEEVIAHMQDNLLTDGMITGVTAYCSPEWFAKFIAHAKIVAAYQYYSSAVEPLRNRAGGSGMYRSFQYQGVNFVEVRTILAGQRLVPSGKVVFVPNGTEGIFKTYTGPANRIGYTGTVAEDTYLWTFTDQKLMGVDIEAEANFACLCRRPALMVEGTTSN